MCIRDSLHIDPLPAQNDRTDWNAFVFTDEIRNGKGRLIGSDSTSLRIPREKLDDVLSRKQRKTGVVLNWTLRQLTGPFAAQLELDLVAHVRVRRAVVVPH